MANVNDTSRVESRLANQWDRLKEADIDDRDREAIRAFVEYRRDIDNLSASSLIANLSPLRLAAIRTSVPLLDMDVRDYGQFINLLKRPKSEGGYGMDPETGTRRYKYPLRVFFGWLTDREDYGDYPFYEDISLCDTMSDTVDRSHTLSRAEVLALKRGAKRPRDKALIGFLADTGGRKTLVLNLRVGDIHDLGESVPTYTPNDEGIGQKDAPNQHYPILHARAELRTYINRHHVDPRPEAPLWHVLRGYDPDNPGEGALSSSRLDSILNEARKNAPADIDKDRVHPHNFRHFRFTELDRSGEHTPQEMQYAGGWSSRDMVDHYSHTTDDERLAAFNEKAGFDDVDAGGGNVDPETVVICGNCQRELYSEERFCPECGAAQVDDAGNRLDSFESRTKDQTIEEDDSDRRRVLLKLADAAGVAPGEVESLLD